MTIARPCPPACHRGTDPRSALRGVAAVVGTTRKGPRRLRRGPLRWVVLRRSLANPSAPLKTLISRTLRGKRPLATSRDRSQRSDHRGPLASNGLKSQTSLSYPNRQKLLDAYASGMPVKQIAERFGVHRTTITQIAASAGVTMRNQPLSPAVQEEASCLYDSGLSLAQVAERLKVAPSAVRTAVLATGRTIRPAGRSTREPAHT